MLTEKNQNTTLMLTIWKAYPYASIDYFGNNTVFVYIIVENQFYLYLFVILFLFRVIQVKSTYTNTRSISS